MQPQKINNREYFQRRNTSKNKQIDDWTENFELGTETICYACAQLMDLYQMRYQTIVFQPISVQDALKELKNTSVFNWQKK